MALRWPLEEILLEAERLSFVHTATTRAHPSGGGGRGLLRCAQLHPPDVPPEAVLDYASLGATAGVDPLPPTGGGFSYGTGFSSSRMSESLPGNRHGRRYDSFWSSIGTLTDQLQNDTFGTIPKERRRVASERGGHHPFVGQLETVLEEVTEDHRDSTADCVRGSRTGGAGGAAGRLGGSQGRADCCPAEGAGTMKEESRWTDHDAARTVSEGRDRRTVRSRDSIEAAQEQSKTTRTHLFAIIVAMIIVLLLAVGVCVFLAMKRRPAGRRERIKITERASTFRAPTVVSAVTSFLETEAGVAGADRPPALSDGGGSFLVPGGVAAAGMVVPPSPSSGGAAALSPSPGPRPPPAVYHWSPPSFYMLHGCRLSVARQILSNGRFTRSADGVLGEGVYMSALVHNLKKHIREETTPVGKHPGVVLRCEVWPGMTKEVKVQVRNLLWLCVFFIPYQRGRTTRISSST